MKQVLENKIAIVTGAGSGIGAAAAARFAIEGAAVACVDFNLDGAKEVAKQIVNAGGKAIAIQADVASDSDMSEMVKTTVKELGIPTIVYANAGVAGSGRAGDISLTEWNRVIGINLTGVWLSSKYLLPLMIEAGGGSIVNQSSVGGIIGVPGIASYAAAKGGVIGLTKQMAVDYGKENIRVNAICPGTVPTPLVEKTYSERGGFAAAKQASGVTDYAEILELARARFPMGRLGTVHEIAALALFLASDESSWITGQAIAIDGGMSVQ
jgi:NAD(P)-dependent dehydrogenase (short-subunit alcohol dehydrogenase family)